MRLPTPISPIIVLTPSFFTLYIQQVLMILTNEIDRLDYGNLLKPVLRIHNKLFANYRKWCEHVGSLPLLNRSIEQVELSYNNDIYNNNYTNGGSGGGNSNSSNDNNENINKIEQVLSDILLWFLIYGEAGTEYSICIYIS